MLIESSEDATCTSVEKFLTLAEEGRRETPPVQLERELRLELQRFLLLPGWAQSEVRSNQSEVKLDFHFGVFSIYFLPNVQIVCILKYFKAEDHSRP